MRLLLQFGLPLLSAESMPAPPWLSGVLRRFGIRELKGQVQTLSSTTDSVRDRTADALNRLEQLVRGKDRQKDVPGGS